MNNNNFCNRCTDFNHKHLLFMIYGFQGHLFDKALCNRKNLTMMVYQWLRLYSSVNLTGEEFDK